MPKNKTVIYPAVFSPEPDDSAINVTFPDVPEAITYGHDEKEAAYSANEVLGLVLANRKKLPKASVIKDIKLEEANDYVVMIAVDLKAAKKQIKVVTITKNVNIPVDLAEEAKKRDINFSQVLIEALREKLDKS